MKFKTKIENVKASKEPWTEQKKIIVTAFSESEPLKKCGLTLHLPASAAKAFPIGRELVVTVKPR
jgi:hypothetical protein